MKRHLRLVIAAFLSAITCGATFLFALYRQFAMVEVAASLATGVELYFLSSSIGDLLEDQKEPSPSKLLASVALAAAVVAYFMISKYLHP
jgi:hypothetical protein